MTGLEILKAPGTTAEQIADIIAEHCPPITSENCDKLSCRACWLAWLATGEPPKEEGSSDERTTPHSGASQKEQLLGDEPAPQRYRLNVIIEDDKLSELNRLLGLWVDRDIG